MMTDKLGTTVLYHFEIGDEIRTRPAIVTAVTDDGLPSLFVLFMPGDRKRTVHQMESSVVPWEAHGAQRLDPVIPVGPFVLSVPPGSRTQPGTWSYIEGPTDAP